MKTTKEQRDGLRSAMCDEGHNLLPLRSCTYETGDHSICVGPEGQAYDVCDVPKGNEAYLALIVAAVNALPNLLDDMDAAEAKITELERERDEAKAWLEDARAEIQSNERVSLETLKNVCEESTRFLARADRAEKALREIADAGHENGNYCDVEMSNRLEPECDCTRGIALAALAPTAKTSEKP